MSATTALGIRSVSRGAQLTAARSIGVVATSVPENLIEIDHLPDRAPRGHSTSRADNELCHARLRDQQKLPGDL
jgi:hypothetical protein